MRFIIGILFLVIGFGVALTTYTMVQEYIYTKKSSQNPAPNTTSIIIAALYTLVILSAGIFCIIY